MAAAEGPGADETAFAKFEGKWKDDAGSLVTIQGKTIQLAGFEGVALELAVEQDGENCFFRMDETVCRGRIEPGGQLAWSDGAIWTREPPSPPPQMRSDLAIQSSAVPPPPLPVPGGSTKAEDASHGAPQPVARWLAERRRDPETWEWLTFHELKQRYEEDYSKEMLKQYWDDSCLEERRVDREDGQVRTWREFEIKQHHLSNTPQELWDQWQACEWAEEEPELAGGEDTAADGGSGEGVGNLSLALPTPMSSALVPVGMAGNNKKNEERRVDSDGQTLKWWDFRMKYDGNAKPEVLQQIWRELEVVDEGVDWDETEMMRRNWPAKFEPEALAAAVQPAGPKIVPEEEAMRWLTEWDDAAKKAGFE